MTIRSQIGSAEVSLEGTEVRTAMTESLLMRYDTEALLLAVGEVLRGIGPEHLSDTAEQVLTLIDGEDLPVRGVAPLVGRQHVTYRGAEYEVAYVDLVSAEPRNIDEPPSRIRVILTLDNPEEIGEPRSAEDEDEDNLPWSPPVAGATGDPRL